MITITFTGPAASGKTTLINKIVELLEKEGFTLKVDQAKHQIQAARSALPYSDNLPDDYEV